MITIRPLTPEDDLRDLIALSRHGSTSDGYGWAYRVGAKRLGSQSCKR
jgi:hypothetical protein